MWPEKILISDGYDIDPHNEATSGTTPNGGEKYCFPSLNKAWNDVEDAIDQLTDTWGDMLVWSPTIYCAFEFEFSFTFCFYRYLRNP